jgi:hypothetical protein
MNKYNKNNMFVTFMLLLLLLIQFCYFKVGDNVGLIGADPWICKIIKVNDYDCSYTVQFHTLMVSLEDGHEYYYDSILYNIRDEQLVPIKRGKSYCY